MVQGDVVEGESTKSKTAADVEDAVEDTVEVTLAARYVVIEAFLIDM